MKWMVAISLSLCIAFCWMHATGFVDDGTTEPSCGRHLIRQVPANTKFHLVYDDGTGVVRYGYTTNAGANWSLQAIDTEFDCRNPSIGLVYTNPPRPCVCYGHGFSSYHCRYRWYNGASWSGYEVGIGLPVETGLVTYLDSAYFVFNGLPSGGPGDDEQPGMIQFAYSRYNATQEAGYFTFNGDNGQSPSIAVDGDGNVYVTYCDAIDGQIKVWRRLNNGTNTWQGPIAGPGIVGPGYTQIQTFCEVFGDSIFVGWCEEHPLGGQLSRNVYRQSEWLPAWPIFWWRNTLGSEEPDIAEESPAIADGEFLVLGKGPLPDLDLCYVSRRFGQGWLPGQPTGNPSTYPSIQMREKARIDLWYAWTEKPYQVWYQPTWWPLGKNDLGRKYYAVTVGCPEQSHYCVKRDGYKTYSEYRIDYADDALEYRLHYLDPKYDFVLQGLTYFEGQQPAKADLLIDGEKAAVLLITPGAPVPFAVIVPRRAYEPDSRIEIAVKRTGGDYVPIAELAVYQFEPEAKGESGVQAASLGESRPGVLRISPNPATDHIRFVSEGAGLCFRQISVFDASGRLVKSMAPRAGLPSAEAAIAWDLRDDAGVRLPQGVYIVRAVLGDRVISRKFVLMK